MKQGWFNHIKFLKFQRCYRIVKVANIKKSLLVEPLESNLPPKNFIAGRLYPSTVKFSASLKKWSCPVFPRAIFSLSSRVPICFSARSCKVYSAAPYPNGDFHGLFLPFSSNTFWCFPGNWSPLIWFCGGCASSPPTIWPWSCWFCAGSSAEFASSHGIVGFGSTAGLTASCEYWSWVHSSVLWRYGCYRSRPASLFRRISRST